MRWIVSMVVLAGIALATGCELIASVAPPEQQGEGGSTGGSTASGGTTTSSETTTTTDETTSTTSSGGTGGTTTTSSTTTTTGPTVPCGWPSPPMECEPGQVCCFDKLATDADFCANPGLCDPPSKYAELNCNENADCQNGKVCCGFYALDADQQYRVQKTYCATSCEAANQELATCTDSSCPVTLICTEIFGSSYPTYKFCLGP